MNDLLRIIDMVFTEEVYKCVLSKPSNKDIEYRKINIDFARWSVPSSKIH